MDIAMANMEEDSTVPKVAIEVATSVIQTGSSRGGYHKGWSRDVDYNIEVIVIYPISY